MVGNKNVQGLEMVDKFLKLRSKWTSGRPGAT